MTSARTIPLDDPRATDRRVVGQKAATLAALRRGGMEVPPGWVVPATSSAPDAALAAELRSASGDGHAWAVRSSAEAEDLDEGSAAGRFLTLLHVADAELADAVARVRRSSPAGTPIPVLIQPMVAAAAAGVAYTADPLTGDPRITVIEATRGLGDRVTGGSAEPERWTVGPDGAECHTDDPRALGADDARAIARSAAHAAEHAGAPQDVEWALEGGKVVLLQARPIAVSDPAASEPRSADDGSTWLLDGGHFPEPVSPMGSETARWVEHALPIAFSEFGVLLSGIRARPIGWRMYMQPVPLAPGTDVRRRAAAAARARATRLDRQYVERWHREWHTSIRERITRHRAIDLSDLSDMELVDELDARNELGAELAVIHFRLFVPHALAVHRFVRFCGQHLGWSDEETARRLAGLSPGTRTQVDDLMPVVEAIREAPELRARFDGGLPELADLTADARLGAAIEAYLDVYGLRTPALDILEPSLDETPHLLVATMGRLLRADATRETSRREFASEAADRLDRAAPPGRRGARYRELLADLRRAYAVRDANLLWTIDLPLGLWRRVALEMGARLHARGALERAADVVFLFTDEARGALLGDAEVSRVARRRRAEHRWARTHPARPFHGPPPTPPPSLRGAPPAAREVTEAMRWITRNDTQARTAGDGVSGVGASAGVHRGAVRIVTGEGDFRRVGPGDVIVAPVANPAWSPLFTIAGALVTDTGGILSHAAILAREFGLPAVMGTGDATRRLAEGEIVTVDGVAGTIRVEDAT
ncbi:PEP/pyruvate-binding domain-containing protein [Agromyces sp. SYSU T0242]|uniref:PEP/pyruvate-binding domain-containing protein n=1 Tax=Agromyces litoreus TaxID=3158561 RepID=UPI0033948725